MVDHLTRVFLGSTPAAPRDLPLTAAGVLAEADRVRAHAGRVAGMMEVLAALRFGFRRAGARIVAESADVEARQAKARLLAAGFEDREFQIVLEYRRRWGIL